MGGLPLTWILPELRGLNCPLPFTVIHSEEQTVSVGYYAPNPFSLHDMHGNVYECVEDCWHDNYEGAPSDGSAWTSGCEDDDWRVLRGGSWTDNPRNLRSANRHSFAPSNRSSLFGFRLVQDLDP